MAVFTQNEILNQLHLILLLVLQHSLEVFLPAGDVDRVDGLLHHLSWRRLSLGVTRWETRFRTHLASYLRHLRFYLHIFLHFI